MLSSLAAAVSAVPDGSTVYLGNFGAQLFAVGHELIRQRRRDLHVVLASGGILLDDLIAEGVTRHVTLSHCWNPVGPVKTEHFQREAQEGRLHLCELSYGALCSALHAAAQDVPFTATTDLSGTDYLDPERNGGMLTTVRCEFGSATVVRALAPDVAFVHVDTANRSGDGWLTQPTADALLAAQASRSTVLVAEHLGAGGGPATIPGLLVDAVVMCAGAVRPDGAAGRYARDLEAYADYSRQAGTSDGRASWRAAVAASRG
ncbi:CoA-transferase [Sporichthya polymorpha]|uniref:CoA-transferase n=1 Tax=Sporichthya polymorpha TaxID=35751 RepID=UPI000360C8B8|nr:CoA transferase [Sporichthya polymorpha]